MENWDEIRTAYQVARNGTVSGAADALGVHHATVIRHIDALEKRLGVKLFQRHARGYTPTEAGSDLLRVAQATEDQFGQLASRIKGRGSDVSGDLVVTSLAAMATRIAPLLAAFQAKHPDIIVRYLTGERLFRLEYGEAHVAVRAGQAPEQPDNIAQPLACQSMGLYGSAGYIKEHGRPETIQDLSAHRFVGSEQETSRAPCFKWMREEIPRENVVFRSDDMRVLSLAVVSGAGLGFLPVQEAKEQTNLVQVMAPRPEWASPLWLVTHMDLHRTSKVQALLAFFKENLKEEIW
ncbi:LysR family transcriptional regulator [Sulfitobacter donghicola]|uniref:LysR family transcriptional regulator n=1 Tax=Sulfitobacter donghicola DSW-25 = KCTC 12864 = JCM 14565 TaxID=1300350 RepID=A0A073IZZ4_9RHOB|nr:LysR family transcriptional regulator [Sulfitobacter donghicola]KEJ90967.1 LysR family transcriptional regulator [Sulfitobacter donghicola DSW-25 = KCTC 12864 = JCM 14565]KIN68259.1 Transcriptional regulator, LysR family [Sulfitobacter donghicola DSW-25 = KCTC 12864 = JCM 14565]